MSFFFAAQMQYLFYSFTDDPDWPHWGVDPAGIAHQELQLKVLCREAAWLGRMPVFPRILSLHEGHNFDIVIRRPVNEYLDLENIEVLYRPNGGSQPDQALSLAAINEIELRSLDIPPDEILKLPAEAPVSAEQNRRFRLISRRMAPKLMWQNQRAPLRSEACALKPESVDCAALEKEREILRVALRPSAQVRELAADIIRRLPRGYCAIHVRRGDLLKFPAIRIWTSPKAVARSLERAGLAPGVPLYLMSDEPSRRWLRRTRSLRPFLHRSDFPRLGELIRPPKPDNYFLFLVEREIFEHAETKFVLKPARSSPRDHKQLFPVSISIAQLRELYHPAELDFSAARMTLHRSFRCYAGLMSKARRLVKDGAFLLLKFARYWMLRLFAPKMLKKYRERRKKLGVPG